MADIYSAISQLENAISELKSKESRLVRELNELANGCLNANNLLNLSRNRINNSMSDNQNALDYSKNAMNLTLQTQLQIKELFYIFKDIETANKKIRMLNNKLYFEFKNQAKVRKVVRSFLDNQSLKLIDDDKIEKIIEKSHLQTPDFWLTFVLLSIIAWKNNEKEKCERCIESALEIDSKSTIIFMMLFNLKIKRINTALKWFECYSSLEKVGKDEDTYLMLLSSIPVKINERNSLNEEDIANKIIDFILLEIENAKAEINETEFVQTIMKFFEKMDNYETMVYDNIRRYVSDYQNMAQALSRAKNNKEILDYLETISQVKKRENNGIIDKYIDELINTPSNGEIQIRREIEYNEEIINTIQLIKAKDNIITSSTFKEIAKENYDQKMHHDSSKLNICNELLKWGFTKKNTDLNTLTTWNIFVLNLPYIKKGYALYRQNYLNLNANEHKITIGDFSIITSLNNINMDIDAKNNFIENKKSILLKKARKTMFVIFQTLAIISLVGGILLKIYSKDSLSYLLLIVAAIFETISIVSLITSVFKKKKINERMALESEKLERIINNLYEEKNKFDKEFEEVDSINLDIQKLINNI